MKSTLIFFLLFPVLAVAEPQVDYIKFNCSPNPALEKFWRDALAETINGQTEVKIPGGRIDVMTDSEVIELDFIHKWHEGLGQALHYADATGKEGVLALISLKPLNKLSKKERTRLDLIGFVCARHDVQVIVLCPSK